MDASGTNRETLQDLGSPARTNLDAAAAHSPAESSGAVRLVRYVVSAGWARRARGSAMKIAPLAAALLLILSVAPVQAATPVLRLVTLGDSITDSHWAKPATWPTIVSADSPRLTLVYNAGVHGNTTAQMLARTPLMLTDHHPNVVTLLGGTNDDLRGLSLSAGIANLKSIVDLCHADGAVVIMMTLPPNKLGVATWNAAITALAQEEGAPLVDIHAVLSQPDGTWIPSMQLDGIHPSPAGNVAEAKAILAVANALWP